MTEDNKLTTFIPTLADRIGQSKYFNDMSISFGASAFLSLSAALHEYKINGMSYAVVKKGLMIPAALTQQLLVKTFTEKLVQLELISTSMKSVIDVANSGTVFVNSYFALNDLLKPLFGQSMASSIEFGTVTIPNLISLDNLMNAINKDFAEHDAPHDAENIIGLDKNYPATKAAIAYTPTLYLKYIFSPEAVTGLYTGIQQYVAGGIGYATAKGLGAYLSNKTHTPYDYAFEFEVGGFNHLLYGTLGSDTVVESNYVKNSCGDEVAVNGKVAIIVEGLEQIARVNMEVITEQNVMAYNYSYSLALNVSAVVNVYAADGYEYGCALAHNVSQYFLSNSTSDEL
ncbi:MAG: hypothetical protein ACHP65_09860 [Legionellales bacterium]